MERRVFLNDGRNAQERFVPIPHLLVTATTLGAAQTLYTVRSGVALEIKRLAVCGVDSGTIALSLHSIPDGGTANNGTLELNQYPISSHGSVDLTDVIGGFYAEGTVLKVFSTASVVMHGYARELL